MTGSAISITRYPRAAEPVVRADSTRWAEPRVDASGPGRKASLARRPVSGLATVSRPGWAVPSVTVRATRRATSTHKQGPQPGAHVIGVAMGGGAFAEYGAVPALRKGKATVWRQHAHGLPGTHRAEGNCCLRGTGESHINSASPDQLKGQADCVRGC